MKVQLLILLGFILSMSCSFAQGTGNTLQNKREQVQAQKVAFITAKLNLTAEEAQQFWPLYNEYQKKKGTVLKERKLLMEKLRNNTNTISEDEYEAYGDKYIELNLEESKLANEYHQKFKSVLKPSQVIILYKAENQFKQWLLKQIRNRKGNIPNRKN